MSPAAGEAASLLLGVCGFTPTEIETAARARRGDYFFSNRKVTLAGWTAGAVLFDAAGTVGEVAGDNGVLELPPVGGRVVLRHHLQRAPRVKPGLSLVTVTSASGDRP